jgi:hypothetical protein
MKKSRIASPVPHPESSPRHLPFVDLFVDTTTELLELRRTLSCSTTSKCSITSDAGTCVRGDRRSSHTI